MNTLSPNLPQTQPPQTAETYNLRRRIRNGANNFYWIAGLSVINSIIMFFDGKLQFVIGLGATQFIDAIVSFAKQDSALDSSVVTIATVIALILDLFIVGLFALCGFLASKDKRWAFIAGAVLYGLDALLVLYFEDFFGFAFHLLMLWGIVSGLLAIGQLNKLMPQPGIQDEFPQSIGN